MITGVSFASSVVDFTVKGIIEETWEVSISFGIDPGVMLCSLAEEIEFISKGGWGIGGGIIEGGTIDLFTIDGFIIGGGIIGGGINGGGIIVGGIICGGIIGGGIIDGGIIEGGIICWGFWIGIPDIIWFNWGIIIIKLNLDNLETRFVQKHR